MKLPKSMTTVTPFTKLLALLLFILFPVIAFFLGREYQKIVEYSEEQKIRLQSISVKQPTINDVGTITQRSQVWNEYTNSKQGITFLYPSSLNVSIEPSQTDLFSLKLTGQSFEIFIYDQSLGNDVFLQSDKKIIVDGVETIQYRHANNAGIVNYLKKGDKEFTFLIMGNDNKPLTSSEERVFTEVLESFKVN